MTTTKLKIIALSAVGIYFIMAIVLRLLGFKNTKPKVFYSIDNGSQKKLNIAPKYRKELFEELNKKYSWDNFDEYDNRFWVYMEEFFDTLPELANKTTHDEDFFNRLTRGQKVFYSVLAFTGDVDNGGVWQFFWNQPEFTISTLEAFKELRLEKLKTDYEKCVDEFLKTNDSYTKRKVISKHAKSRWTTFTRGYHSIQSAKILEEYFYDKEFKKELYKTVVDYVDRNIGQFVRK